MNFLDYIVTFFEMIWNFVSNLLNGLITLLGVMVQAVVIPPTLVGFVPGFLGTCITCVGAIGIAKLIVGWGNK